ncbi:MAG: DUF1294 domain-containing protein [Bacillota bacterium]
MTIILLIATIIMSIVAFFAMLIDKKRAIKGKWRIPEATLIGMAFFMGGIGEYMGMKTFRHKTKHIKFTIGVPLCIVVNVAVLVGSYLTFGL